MTWLLEQPWPILLVGVAVEAILVVALVQTRRLSVMIAMSCVLLLTVAMLALEQLVVTPVEQVEGVLYTTAAALEANDRQAVLARISPGATRIRLVVEQGMARLEFTKAKIVGKLEITINELTLPPSATARFLGMINGRTTSDGQNVTRLARFTIKLRREGDTWLVSDYEEQR